MDWALTGAIIGLIIAFCLLLDWLVSKKEEDNRKVTIIKWWDRLDDFSYSETIQKSNIFCTEIFNKIYGKEHFTGRCFRVSLCVSFFFAFILLSIQRIITFDPTIRRDIVEDLSAVFLLSLMANSVIDYVSLIETRAILKFASRTKHHMLPVLLLVDLFLTAIIFLLPVMFIIVSSRDRGHWTQVAQTDWQYSCEVLSDIVSWEHLMSICFYTTFSTSVIFYLYCLSTLFFKLVKLSKTRIMVVLEKLEDSDHLFKALGGFLAAVVVFVKAVVEIYQHITS